MVKHHVKKKKGKSHAQMKKEEDLKLQQKLQDIDRFAGSSEEEDNTNNDDSDEDDDDDEMEEQVKEPQSEEENDDDDDDDDDDEEQDGNKNNNSDSSDEDEYGDVDSDDDENENENKNKKDDDDDEYNDQVKPKKSKTPSHMTESKALGMSNAMAKILGIMDPSSSKTPEEEEEDGDGDDDKEDVHDKKKGKHKSQTTTSAILSKTKTKLQKQQEQEKLTLQALRQKRKQRRTENLSVMHIPTAAGGIFSNWEEINMERSHRRVATRGVVALFNAISKHQLAQKEQLEQANATGIVKKNKHEDNGDGGGGGGGSSGVQNMTKRGFLDALKESANKKEDKQLKKKTSLEEKENHVGANGKEKDGKRSTGGRAWNALQDDFMMGSKLKDWDKELSDNSSSSEDEGGGKPQDLSDNDDDDDDDDASMDDAPKTKQRPIHGKRAIGALTGKARKRSKRIS